MDNETYYIEIGDQESQSDCVSNFQERRMKCPIPPGSGKDRPLVLYRYDGETNQDIDTNVLEGCKLTYALPNVVEIRGCGANGTCSREGGDVVEIVGSNFGSSSALVFVNGQECLNTAQNGHGSIDCTLPALSEQQSSNTILVIQSNQFDAYFGLKYKMCARGERQVENSGACDSCPIGTFSGDEDSLLCDRCNSGKYSSSVGLSECLDCPSNTFAPSTGTTQCEVCPRGRESNSGAVKCSGCQFLYWGSPGNCDVPVTGIMIGIGASIIFDTISCSSIVGWSKSVRSVRARSVRI